VTDRMLQHFVAEQDKPGVADPNAIWMVKASFQNIASLMSEELEPGPERTVALRKLLEARDAALRAARTPGC
jgi:hypothetical protein